MASGGCDSGLDEQHGVGAGCAGPARREHCPGQPDFQQPQADRCYVIGPEDVLHIAVWKEADLTATVPVRPDGKISLPLLNDVQASGMTPEQLAAFVNGEAEEICR